MDTPGRCLLPSATLGCAVWMFPTPWPRTFSTRLVARHLPAHWDALSPLYCHLSPSQTCLAIALYQGAFRNLTCEAEQLLAWGLGCQGHVPGQVLSDIPCCVCPPGARQALGTVARVHPVSGQGEQALLAGAPRCTDTVATKPCRKGSIKGREAKMGGGQWPGQSRSPRPLQDRSLPGPEACTGIQQCATQTPPGLPRRYECRAYLAWPDQFWFPQGRKDSLSVSTRDGLGGRQLPSSQGLDNSSFKVFW